MSKQDRIAKVKYADKGVAVQWQSGKLETYTHEEYDVLKKSQEAIHGPEATKEDDNAR